VRVKLHPEARSELRVAAIWYDEQRPKLGDEFVAEVSAVLDRIGARIKILPSTRLTSGQYRVVLTSNEELDSCTLSYTPLDRAPIPTTAGRSGCRGG
jgi:hypothetical protein